MGMFGLSNSDVAILKKLVAAHNSGGLDLTGPRRRGNPVSGAAVGFWAVVQSSSPENSDPTTKWIYTCKRGSKATAGYGSSAWSVTGDTFTAYNPAENINATTGRQGDGIDVANLTGSFAFYPIQPNTPVIVRLVTVADDGSAEYWIVGAGMPNGVDGGC